MNLTLLFAAFCIGIATGLRAFTGVAVVAWAAYVGCIDLATTPFAFMASPVAAGIISLIALGEYVGDVMANMSSRTAPPALIARVVFGGLAGACLMSAAGCSYMIGALIGAVGGVCGAFGGYQARMRLVKALNIKDIFVAIPEDLVAIGLSIAVVCCLTQTPQ
ncbi:MAG: DUF4126 family protein [Pyrinomonadaceae bacterium]